MDAPPRPAGIGEPAVWSEVSSRLIIEIATAASGELDLDQILNEALDRLRTVAPLTGGSIALVDGDDLVIRAATGPFAAQALGQRLSRNGGRSWKVIDTLVPYRSGDLVRDGERVTAPVEAGAIRSWLAVPIIRNGVGIGLLEIDSTEVGAFDEHHEALLQAVVRVVSGAVEVAAHHAEERRAGELRDAFIGVISHELRTPVTTIYGLARILRRRDSTLDPATREQALVDVEEEADRLTRLIEDLLVLSRAERGRVEVDLEPINLARLVRHIADAESERHPGRRYAFRSGPDLQLVAGESTYVEQVVRNFLSNAAKYSPPGSTIEIELEGGAGESIVRVLDRGIGVDEAATVEAFELFYRTPDAARVASGAGIGLFVCRHLIEAMGGRVWIRPRDGGGTEAGFTLPAVEVDDPED
ncbi:MAG TPA: ATP-binding protein [Candidatus Limnocylindrales bacterium]